MTVAWNERAEARAERLLDELPPASPARLYLEAALDELRRQRTRAVAAERELEAAQRAAADLASAVTYDSKASSTSLSYGLSCRKPAAVTG